MTEDYLTTLLRGDPPPRTPEAELDPEFVRVVAACDRIVDGSPEAVELDRTAASARAAVEAADPDLD